MPQLLSAAHIETIINGHRFQGISDDERPYEFPSDQELVEVKMGVDGGVYGMTKPHFGGPFKIKLEPTSPSVQWCIQQRRLFDRAIEEGTPHVYYSGSYRDIAQGRSAVLSGGFLLTANQMAEQGQIYEITFQFEKIVPNVDGAQFVPTLSTPPS